MDLAADTQIMLAALANANATIDGTQPMDGIFDAPFKGATLYDSTVESSAPAITVASGDIAEREIEHGTPLTLTAINGAMDPDDEGDYYVAGIQPDGAGLTRLILSRDPVS